MFFGKNVGKRCNGIDDCRGGHAYRSPAAATHICPGVCLSAASSLGVRSIYLERLSSRCPFGRAIFSLRSLLPMPPCSCSIAVSSSPTINRHTNYEYTQTTAFSVVVVTCLRDASIPPSIAIECEVDVSRTELHQSDRRQTDKQMDR